jgi:hypothetical protein
MFLKNRMESAINICHKRIFYTNYSEKNEEKVFQNNKFDI